MGERALAHIELIEEVRPIPNADAIEAVRVLGWWVVVRKDLNYKVGDPVVFFEIDSVLPDHPAFEEMLKGKPWSPRAARLKTITLRGQLSQGYVRHVRDVLPDALLSANKSVGTDVTELLGVTKYEPPLPTDTAALAGHWIPGVPKTDEERVQSERGRKALAALQGKRYIISVKLDGMSGTFGLDADGVFWACSRNFRLKYDEKQPHWFVANRYRLAEICQASPDLYFQGEVCGPGVQGNALGLLEPDLFIFDVWNIRTGRYLSWTELVEVCASLGLKTVPYYEGGASFNYTAEALLLKAEGKYESGREREGLVIREIEHIAPDRISFKAVSNRFLLKGGN